MLVENTDFDSENTSAPNELLIYNNVILKKILNIVGLQCHTGYIMNLKRLKHTDI